MLYCSTVAPKIHIDTWCIGAECYVEDGNEQLPLVIFVSCCIVLYCSYSSSSLLAGPNESNRKNCVFLSQLMISIVVRNT